MKTEIGIIEGVKHILQGYRCYDLLDESYINKKLIQYQANALDASIANRTTEGHTRAIVTSIMHELYRASTEYIQAQGRA